VRCSIAANEMVTKRLMTPALIADQRSTRLGIRK